MIQAVVGIWLLESVNYLEHYGMRRQKLESGRYERVNPSHSWNSNNIGTNVLLYHLQRHSDHHANPTRRYQALRDFPEAPVLPTGYAGMIVLTWVPAVWRRVMDKRVVAHYDGDVTRANLHPGKAAAATCAGTHRPPRVRDRRSCLRRLRWPRFVCPSCDYVYDEARGRPPRGLAGRHPVRRDRPRLGLPRLRRPGAAGLRAASERSPDPPGRRATPVVGREMRP